ncbi:uncharacterized protein LOC119670457 [Teleopsis dalmanni]|uniref:uncharacterized protein LOC119670457 n=1 Tax=Teleopsis dalmanni TaxID=139649 RepID=UPI0018CDAD50|nr:uncharacterized protein LOC119670457 [Teleopsis dalmanni]
MADFINSGLKVGETRSTDSTSVRQESMPLHEKAKLNDIVFSQCYDFTYYSNYIKKLEEKRLELNVNLSKLRAAGIDSTNMDYVILNDRERNLHNEQLACKKLMDNLGFATLAYNIGGLESVAIIARAAATNGASVRNQKSGIEADDPDIFNLNAGTNNESQDKLDENDYQESDEETGINQENNIVTCDISPTIKQNECVANTRSVDSIPLPEVQTVTANTSVTEVPVIHTNDLNHVPSFNANPEPAPQAYRPQNSFINNQTNGSFNMSFQATSVVDSHLACNFYPIYNMLPNYGPILVGYQIVNVANYQSAAVYHNYNLGYGSSMIPPVRRSTVQSNYNFNPYMGGYAVNHQQSVYQCYVHVSSMTGVQYDYSTFSQQTLFEWNQI